MRDCGGAFKAGVSTGSVPFSTPRSEMQSVFCVERALHTKRRKDEDPTLAVKTMVAVLLGVKRLGHQARRQEGPLATGSVPRNRVSARISLGISFAARTQVEESPAVSCVEPMRLCPFVFVRTAIMAGALSNQAIVSLT